MHSITETIETYQASQAYIRESQIDSASICDSDKVSNDVHLILPVEQTTQAYSDLLFKSEIGGLPAGSTDISGLRLSKRYARALFHAFGAELPVTSGTIGSGNIVLDLDYNAVDDLRLIARKVGYKGYVVNIENTDEAVKNTKNELFEEGLTNVDIRKGFIENLPFEASSFDYLVSNRPLNLTSSLPNVFAEIKRVLKPGGTAFIADITVEELPEWVLKTEQLNRSSITGAIGKEEYIAGFKQAGFDTVLEREIQILSSAEISNIIGNDQTYNIPKINNSKTEYNSSTESIIEAVSGKILSVVFFVRKPV